MLLLIMRNLLHLAASDAANASPTATAAAAAIANTFMAAGGRLRLYSDLMCSL
jgi:hypothetical protein